MKKFDPIMLEDLIEEGQRELKEAKEKKRRPKSGEFN
jgi:hypothetical protein